MRKLNSMKIGMFGLRTISIIEITRTLMEIDLENQVYSQDYKMVSYGNKLCVNL